MSNSKTLCGRMEGERISTIDSLQQVVWYLITTLNIQY